MKSVSIDTLTESVQPSRLVAEALVRGCDAETLLEKARELGLHENLAHAMVSVCCRERVEEGTSLLVGSTSL